MLNIQFYDEEGDDYPLLCIDENDKQKVEELLDSYRINNKEGYNFDDFLRLLEDNEIGFETYTFDERWYF